MCQIRIVKRRLEYKLCVETQGPISDYLRRLIDQYDTQAFIHAKLAEDTEHVWAEGQAQHFRRHCGTLSHAQSLVWGWHLFAVLKRV